RVNQIVTQVDDLMRQLTALQEQLRSATASGVTQQGGNTAAALTAVQTAISKLRQFRDDELARPLPGLGYRQFPRLREEVNSLSGVVARAIAPPTDQAVGRMKELDVE